MANSIVQHQYQDFRIPQRESDGYVDLTKMAAAYGKKVNDFLRLKQTVAYLAALSSDTGIPVTELLQVVQGGVSENQGTWAQPEVSVKFAAWLSPELEVWAMRTLVQVINSEPAPPALPVPTVAEQATMLFAAFQGFGLTDSPRHMQLAKDHIGNLLSPKTLPPSEAPWLGVVEIAEAMGYNKYQVSQVCSGLGRVVAAWYRGEAGDEPATEDRLVSGRTCSLKVYKRSEDLDTIIAAYLTAKGLEAA